MVTDNGLLWNKNQIKFVEGISSSFDLRQAQLQLYNAQQIYLQASNELLDAVIISGYVTSGIDRKKDGSVPGKMGAVEAGYRGEEQRDVGRAQRIG